MSPTVNRRSSSPLRSVSRLLAVRPGEWATLGLLFVYVAASTGGLVTVGRTVAASLFVGSLGPSSTAYLLILPAIATTLGIALYNRLSRGIGLGRLVVGSNLVVLGALVVGRVLLSTSIGGRFVVLAGIYLLVEFAYTIVGAQLWTLTLRVLDARQAKRLIGLVGAVGTTAGLLAALGLTAVADIIGPADLLWVVVASVGLCAMCARALVGRTAPAESTEEASGSEPERVSLAADLRSIVGDPLTRAIAGLTILQSLLLNLTFFVLVSALGRRFVDDDASIVGYLAAVDLIGGLVGVVVQVWLTRRLIARFGLTGALYVFPAVIAIVAVIGLANDALWPLGLLLVADAAANEAAFEPAINLLATPLPRRRRERLRPLLEATYAVSFGVAGVVVLIVGSVDDSVYQVALGLLALAAIAVARWTRPRYVDALDAAMRARWLDASALGSSAETISALRRTLADPDPLRVAHAVALLSELGADGLEGELRRLLDHPAGEVRCSAGSSLLDRQGDQPDGASAIADRLISDSDPTVRLVGVRWLARAPESGREALERALSDTVALVAGTAAASLRTVEGDDRAASTLTSLIDDERPEIRRAAASSLVGSAFDDDARRWLTSLLADSEPSVRLEAARALAMVPSALDILIDRLDEPTIAAAAAGSVASNGATALLEAIADVPPTARDAAYRAFARRGDEVVLAAVALDAQIQRELSDAHRLAVWQLVLDGRPVSLLRELILERERSAIERVLLLFELGDPERAVRVRRSREQLDRRGHTRALAVELLSTVVGRDELSPLLALLEGPPERILGQATTRFAIAVPAAEQLIAELAGGGDPVLALLAGERDPDRDALASRPNKELTMTMTMSTVERVLLLKRAELFGELGTEELVALAGVAEVHSFAPGEVLIHDGGDADCLYVIAAGEIVVRRRDGVELVRRHAGESVGEMGIVSRNARRGTCAAVEEVTALRIGRAEFWDLLGESRLLALGVISALSDRLDEAVVNFHQLGV